MNLIFKILKYLAFHFFWLLCAKGANTSYEIYLLILPLIYFFIVRHEIQKPVIKALVISLIAGYAFDIGLQQFGLIHFKSAVSDILPIWLLCIWSLFTLSTFLWVPAFKNKKMFFVFLFAIAGPANYWFGQGLQVLSITSLYTLVAYVFFWKLYAHYIYDAYFPAKN